MPHIVLALSAYVGNLDVSLLRAEQAMGKAAYTGNVAEEGEDAEADEDTAEAELTISAA
jgi:hypothetical protein